MEFDGRRLTADDDGISVRRFTGDLNASAPAHTTSGVKSNQYLPRFIGASNKRRTRRRLLRGNGGGEGGEQAEELEEKEREGASRESRSRRD